MSVYVPPPFGMTAQQLADDVQEFLKQLKLDKLNPGLVKNCMDRIVGTGDEQYGNDGKFQNFEVMPLHELFDYSTEELEDFVNYVEMVAIRVFRHVDAMHNLSDDAKRNWRAVAAGLEELAASAGAIHHNMGVLRKLADEQREKDFQAAIPDGMRPDPEKDAVEPEPKEETDE